MVPGGPGQEKFFVYYGKFCTIEHIGTHLDAPQHVLKSDVGSKNLNTIDRVRSIYGYCHSNGNESSFRWHCQMLLERRASSMCLISTNTNAPTISWTIDDVKAWEAQNGRPAQGLHCHHSHWTRKVSSTSPTQEFNV